MRTIDLAQLASVHGGQAADCPITNKTDQPVTVYQSNLLPPVELGPGQSGAVKETGGVFYPWNDNGPGSVDGCRPGRSFQLVPNTPYYPGMPRTERTSG